MPPPQPRILRAAAALATLALAACAQAGPTVAPTGMPTTTAPAQAPTTTAATGPAAPATPPATPTAAAPASADRLTVTISGDLLWHDGLLREAAEAGRARGRAYDFEPLFEHVRPLLEKADVSVCHVEVPVAPAGVTPRGYPTFASPAETLEAARAVGFDYCTTASNHTFDQGWAGAVRTLDVLDAQGIVHSGSYRTAAEARTPAILTTASGVRFAVVTGAYGLNGSGAVPGGRTWAWDKLDTGAMVARARAAREAGAEIVLAAMHAGTEQQHRPSAQQVAAATALARSGAFDLVYGHHAHVAQPWDRIDGVWVAYGLGNLVGQMKVATPRAYEEYLGRVTFERRGERFEAVRAEYVPLMMTLGRPGSPARVLDVTRALADGTGDAARLRLAREQVAKAVRLLGAEDVEEA